MNLACDLLQKVESAGFPVKSVCVRAGVSPSTIAVLRSQNSNCSQKTYDRMIGALIGMAVERNDQMIDSGLLLPTIKASKECAEAIARNAGRAAGEGAEEEQGQQE